jgi:hypothetical protein
MMLRWLFDTVFSNAVPDIFGILFTVPAVALYIRGSTKKRFCANCQRPINTARRGPVKPAARTNGLIIIEAE